MDNLKYRRQYLISPEKISKYNVWKTETVCENIYIYCHPDLEMTKYKKDNKEIVLLGYILDSQNTNFQNTDILSEIAQSKNENDLFNKLKKYTGRYVLMIKLFNDVIVLSDAVTLRQIFYGAKESKLWISSQSNIIAEILNSPLNKGFAEFYQKISKVDDEYYFPISTTPYENIHKLLPGRFLYYYQNKTARFWPNKKLKIKHPQFVSNKISKILKDTLKSAANRYNIAIALTSGYDSRLLLAASKKIHKKINYYTLKYWNLNEDSFDVKIPGKLSKLLDLKFQTYQCPTQVSSDFNRHLKKYFPFGHKVLGEIIEGKYKEFPDNWIAVKNVIAATRLFYHYKSNLDDLTVKELLKKTIFNNISYAYKYYNDWLKEGKKISKEYNINIGDLFLLENKLAMAHGMYTSQYDIVEEVFEPYNSFLLLELFYSIDSNFRLIKYDITAKYLMKKMWSDVLKIPLIPQKSISFSKLILFNLKFILKKIGIFEFLKKKFN